MEEKEVISEGEVGWKRFVKREIIEVPLTIEENEIRKGYREEIDGIVYDTLWLILDKEDGEVFVRWERFETDHHHTDYLDERDLNGIVGLIKKFKNEISKKGL